MFDKVYQLYYDPRLRYAQVPIYCDLAAKLQASLAIDASAEDVLPLTDLKASFRDVVALLRSSPLIPHTIPTIGAIYDVRSRWLEEVLAMLARVSSLARNKGMLP
jgi:hypothetical protein